MSACVHKTWAPVIIQPLAVSGFELRVIWAAGGMASTRRRPLAPATPTPLYPRKGPYKNPLDLGIGGLACQKSQHDS